MKLEIDIDEDYYKIICKRVEKNKPYHSPYEYEVIADGKPIEQDPTTKNDLGVDREDAVERLNALKQLIGYDKDSEIVKATQKSLDMAIKALYQEPMVEKIDLYSVIKQKYIEREVIDKIFCIVHPLSIMSTPELEHKAIMQIAEMLEPLCLPETEEV